MPDLTIRLSPKTHDALRTTARSCGRSIDEIVEESLDRAGLLSAARAIEWIQEARSGSTLSDDEAMELAVAETRAHRRENLAARTAPEARR